MKAYLPRTAAMLAALVFLAFGSVCAMAQDDIVERFPEIAQVTADYPDDAQRAAAFSTLDDALNAAAPKPVTRAVYERSTEYGGSSNAILSMHMANGGMQNGEYRAFNARYSQFLDDSNFRRSVLEKYQVGGMAAHPRPPPHRCRSATTAIFRRRALPSAAGLSAGDHV